MVFTSLMNKSKDAKCIESAKDIRLDTFIEHIFSKDTCRYFNVSDFVDEYWPKPEKKLADFSFNSRVVQLSFNDVTRTEIEEEEIEKKQDMIKYLISNPELIGLIYQKTIEKEGYRPIDYLTKEKKARNYRDYIYALADTIKTSGCERFNKLLEEVISVKNSAGMKTLNSLLEEKLSYNGKMSILCVAESHLHDKLYPSPKEAKMSMWTESKTLGKKIEFDDNDLFGNSLRYDMPFMYSLINRIEKEFGQRIAIGEMISIDLNCEKDAVFIGKASFIEEASKNKREIPFTIELNIKEEKVKGLIIAMENVYDGYEKELSEFAGIVTELRYFAALAKYFTEVKGKGIQICFPKILGPNEERKIFFKDLYEPNLVNKIDNKTIPNDVEMSQESNMRLITGPNNNGKTTHINSIGIAVATAQAGWPIMALEAIVSPCQYILTHYIETVHGRSRYMDDLIRQGALFKKLNNKSLILIDEPCSGTSYEDGVQQTNGLIRQLSRTGAFVFITTHLHQVIEEVGKNPFGKNLMCYTTTDENGQTKYEYKIVHGSSYASQGSTLAREKGLDENGLKRILEDRAGKGELVLRDFPST